QPLAGDRRAAQADVDRARTLVELLLAERPVLALRGLDDVVDAALASEPRAAHRALEPGGRERVRVQDRVLDPLPDVADQVVDAERAAAGLEGADRDRTAEAELERVRGRLAVLARGPGEQARARRDPDPLARGQEP